MKKMLLMLAVMLASFNANAADTAAQIVEKANKTWNAAFNAGEIDKLTALYAEEATLSPGNGVVLKGHDEINTLFTSFKENGVHNHQIETVDILATDKQITQIGYWKAQGVDADSQPIEFGGVLVTVLKKDKAGQWKLQSHIWNMAQ